MTFGRARWRRELDQAEHESAPPRTHEEAVEQLRAIEKRVRELREKMSPDSPNHMAAFQIHALIGEIEAELNIANAEATSPAQTGLAANTAGAENEPLHNAEDTGSLRG